MRKNALVLTGFALTACSGLAQGPSNIRWSSDRPGQIVAGDEAGYYAQAKTQLAAGNASLALDGFRKALRINPKSIDALNGLGAAYDRIGRFDLSRNYYEQALGLDPASRITLNNFGYSLALQGKSTEAREMLARAGAGGNGAVSGIATRNLAHIPDPAKAVAAANNPAGPRNTPARSWIERLTTSTQLLVTRLFNTAAKPELTSVSTVEADAHSDRPARFSAQYHKQRIFVDAAQLTGMASDEITSGSETATSFVVLNGVGRRGMAGRLAGYLSGKGYALADVGDAAQPIAHSEISYPADQAAAAAAVAARLPFAVKLKPSAQVRLITVIVGTDAMAFDDRLRLGARSA